MLVLSIIIASLVILIALFIAFSYVKCPPDMVFLISGIKKEPRVITGKAAFRIPFFERIDKIPLKLIQIDVRTNRVPTNDYINVDVDAVANVRISAKPELIRIAAKHFLNQSVNDIAVNVQQILEGNMREIIGQMNLTDLVNNKQLFSQKIQENATDDIEKLGLEIVNLNVQNVTDDNDAIVNLGVDNLVKIQKDAKIAKAKAEKEIKIAESAADEEGAKARAEADAKIAEQQKELKLKQASYKKQQDIAKAEADAAYKIQEQEQLRVINETQVAAEVAKAEKMTELKEKEVALKEKELDALVRKQADADKYKAEKEAEAQKIITIQNAEAAKERAKRESEAQIALAEANKRAAELEAEGISAEIINVHTIKPLDEQAVLNSVKKTDCAISCEEHMYNGGLGDAIAQLLVRNYPAPMEFVGIDDQFGQSGTPMQLMEHYHLMAKDIVLAAKKVIQRKK